MMNNEEAMEKSLNCRYFIGRSREPVNFDIFRNRLTRGFQWWVISVGKSTRTENKWQNPCVRLGKDAV